MPKVDGKTLHDAAFQVLQDLGHTDGPRPPPHSIRMIALPAVEEALHTKSTSGHRPVMQEALGDSGGFWGMGT